MKTAFTRPRFGTIEWYTAFNNLSLFAHYTDDVTATVEEGRNEDRRSVDDRRSGYAPLLQNALQGLHFVFLLAFHFDDNN